HHGRRPVIPRRQTRNQRMAGKPMTMTRLNDVQRVERAIAICVAFDLGAPLFAALENDLALLRSRDRALQQRREKPLPRYVTRAGRGYSFQVYPRGPRTRLRGEPGTAEFRAAYSVALVDAIAMENDSDDWPCPAKK